MRRPLCALLLLALVLPLGPGLSAADRQAIPEDPTALAAGWLDREAVLADAATVDQARFPDADEVLVAKHTLVRYRPDGTYVQWHEEYLKILTESAREDHGVLSSYFTIPYQQEEDCQVPLVEVIGADGSSRVIDVAANSRIMTNPRSMGQNIYNPNDRILRINVPGLRVGDLLHFVMYDRVVQPRMRGSFADFASFEQTRPIIRSIMEIDAPAERPLASIALKDPIEGSVSYEQHDHEDGVRHRWEARDVPRIFTEPDMPAFYTVTQRLLVSTEPSWEHVSRWYWDLSLPHYDSDEAIRAKVAELTAGLEDRRARIDALFTYVSQEIRYLGITVEAEAPGYEPHDVVDTFAQKHGVCRDKAALLVVMLREAGYEAFPTLIHNGPKKDSEVPQPWFNHAVVAVRTDEGGYDLLDPTDETTAEWLPAYLNNQSYLVATPEGDPLRSSPIVPAAENLVHIDLASRIGADGTLEGEATLRFAGYNDNAYRGYLARQNEETRRRLFAGALTASLPGAELQSLNITPSDLTDTATPLAVSMTFSQPRSIPEAERGLLRIPSLSRSVGMVNFILRGSTGLEERQYPLRTEVACGVVEESVLRLETDGTRVLSLPSPEPVTAPGIAWQTAVTVDDDGAIHANTDFRLTAVEFDPDEYLALKDALRAIERERAKRIIVATPADDHAFERMLRDVDALIQRDHRTARLHADGSVDIEYDRVIDVRSYAGKKRQAELTIPYNDGWQEVELLLAEVQAPDGSTTAVRPEEINRMDQDWVGGAPRYPAGRILVVALPNVEVGSQIHLRYRMTSRDPLSQSFTALWFDQDPVREARVEVVFAAGVDPDDYHIDTDHLPLHSLHSRSDNADGTTVLSWRLPEIQAMRWEEQLPPPLAFRPSIRIARGDWDDYRQELDEILAERLVDDAALDALLPDFSNARFASLHDQQLAQIRHIRDQVVTRVRLAGPSLDRLPATALSPATATLAAGYGTQADRSILLAAALRRAGFSTEWVLSSPSLPLDDDLAREQLALPMAGVFSHLLLRVPHPDPECAPLLLGAGDQYTPLSVTPLAGHPGLDLATGRWLETVADDHSRNEEHLAIDLDATGTATITWTMHDTGTYGASLRRRLAQQTPEERRRYAQQLAESFAANAELVGALTVIDDDDAVAAAASEAADEATTLPVWNATPTDPGIIRRLELRVPGFATLDGNWCYAELPSALSQAPRLREAERTQPLLLGDRSGSQRTRLTLRPPPGFSLDTRPAAFTDHWPLTGDLAQEVTWRDGTLTVTSRHAPAPTLLPADHAPLAFATAARARAPEYRTVIFRRSTESDSDSDEE